MARSSAEAEYRAMAHGICELFWLKRFMQEIGMKAANPLMLYCDNKAAINIAHNHVQHDRTKHIEIDRKSRKNWTRALGSRGEYTVFLKSKPERSCSPACTLEAQEHRFAVASRAHTQSDKASHLT